MVIRKKKRREEGEFIFFCFSLLFFPRRMALYQQSKDVQVFAQPLTGPGVGVGGLPMSRPYFHRHAEDTIRHGRHFLCCDYPPGPNVPPHWFDGGNGWVTRYFTDVAPFDIMQRLNGRYRCQVGGCNYEVDGTGCCEGNCCWFPTGGAIVAMAHHLQHSHNIAPPPLRQWTTEFCDTEGCFDTICCAPCQGSRQMMALAGYQDTFHTWWCLFFWLAGCRHAQGGGKHAVYWIPPWIYVAVFTRFNLVPLNRIDEGRCATGLKAVCCPICSIAQTYRELKNTGVWSGSTCCNDPPALIHATAGVHMM